MQTPTNQVVEQAIAKADAEDAGIDTTKQDDKKDDSKAQDDSASKSAASRDSKAADDKGAAKDDDKGADTAKKSGEEAAKTEDDKKGEFTADDALEVEEPTPPADGKPAAPTDNAGIALSPAEQTYIKDNIGEPIVLRGYKEVDGKLEPYEVKAFAWENVPRDFKFASDADFGNAQNAFNRLDQKATNLLGQYRQQQSESVRNDFERRENDGIKADVADLQKEGRFPKFTVQPGADGFDDSPEAQQMADVLKVMAQKNEMYLKQYEQGRPYKHIGFAEAFDLWEKSNPDRQAAKKADDDQKKEDDERKTKAADRSDSNRGMSTSNIVKPTVRPGTTTRDILARIDAEY